MRVQRPRPIKKTVGSEPPADHRGLTKSKTYAIYPTVRHLPAIALLVFAIPLSLSTMADGSMTAKEVQASVIAGKSCFMIEDARTHIGIASVKLSVGELTSEAGNLVGEYTIQIPLMKSKNDTGRIVLPLDTSIEELGTTGGTLRGKAYSHKPDKQPNLIVCEIDPQDDQTILLAITTEDRTIEFKSRYRIVPGSI